MVPNCLAVFECISAHSPCSITWSITYFFLCIFNYMLLQLFFYIHYMAKIRWAPEHHLYSMWFFTKRLPQQYLPCLYSVALQFSFTGTKGAQTCFSTTLCTNYYFSAILYCSYFCNLILIIIYLDYIIHISSQMDGYLQQISSCFMYFFH